MTGADWDDITRATDDLLALVVRLRRDCQSQDAVDLEETLIAIWDWWLDTGEIIDRPIPVEDECPI